MNQFYKFKYEINRNQNFGTQLTKMVKFRVPNLDFCAYYFMFPFFSLPLIFLDKWVCLGNTALKNYYHHVVRFQSGFYILMSHLLVELILSVIKRFFFFFTFCNSTFCGNLIYKLFNLKFKYQYLPIRYLMHQKSKRLPDSQICNFIYYY